MLITEVVLYSCYTVCSEYCSCNYSCLFISFLIVVQQLYNVKIRSSELWQ